MPLALGIDTGGTYTDAALVEMDTGRVTHWAKALTTYHDLAVGICRAIDQIRARSGDGVLGKVSLVGLSTTLATNAIVEGRHGRAGLVLIGYDQELIERYGLAKRLVVDRVSYVAGGHDAQGGQTQPLDLEALAEVAAGSSGLEAFGVSGFFSVRNPAHELAARRYLSEATGLPVTCGHELSQNLDSITRATTTALNATLIPILTELIEDVRRALDQRGVSGRLMAVKGDGSLVDADLARGRPVETILSGPAASVVGATHLAGLKEKPDKMWVVDLGGTTTDIALLENGLPAVARDGATVGGLKTMVQAVEVRTVGLGGDSQVCLGREGGFEIRPCRVTPLCQLGGEHPEVADELKRQQRAKVRGETAAVFFLAARNGGRHPDSWQGNLAARLTKGPVSWDAVIAQEGPASFLPVMVYRFVSQRMISLAGFTPTDGLHVLGLLDTWDPAPSTAAAELLAAGLGLSAHEFCHRLLEDFSQRLSRELVLSALAHEGLEIDGTKDTLADWLIDRALDGGDTGGLGCTLTLGAPLVAVGAPVETFAPPAAERLHAKLLIPPMAQVANAVGAVVGGVVLRRKALVKPDQESETFRLHLPGEMLLFHNKEEAVDEARRLMKEELKREALRSGGSEPQISEDRIEQEAALGRVEDGKLYLGTELIFTAVGRPAIT